MSSETRAEGDDAALDAQLRAFGCQFGTRKWYQKWQAARSRTRIVGARTLALQVLQRARPERFELPTFGSVDRRSIQLSYGREVAKCSSDGRDSRPGGLVPAGGRHRNDRELRRPAAANVVTLLRSPRSNGTTNGPRACRVAAPHTGSRGHPVAVTNSGEGGIRTRDRGFPPYSLSRRVPSATRPPLRRFRDLRTGAVALNRPAWPWSRR